MIRRAVILRRAARQDIDEAIGFYLDQGATQAAHRLVDELARVLEQLAEYPEAGSPRYALELDLPGLRHWRLEDYPYLVFYLDGQEFVDVWRVLHEVRDIPAWLGGSP